MSNYGSTRHPSLKRGTAVIVVIYNNIPERTKPDGTFKPAETRSHVKDAVVLGDYGHSIIVKLHNGRTATVFPEQVSLADKWHLGLEASRV